MLVPQHLMMSFDHVGMGSSASLFDVDGELCKKLLGLLIYHASFLIGLFDFWWALRLKPYLRHSRMNLIGGQVYQDDRLAESGARVDHV